VRDVAGSTLGSVRASRVVGAAGLLVAAGCLLVACGSSPAPAALSRCTAAQLTVTQAAAQGGAGLGHVSVVVLVHDVATSACTLHGYPTVALAAEHGGAIVSATKTPSGYMGGFTKDTTTLPRVTILPGGVASFMVEGTDVPGPGARSCPTYGAMEITAPETTLHKSLVASLPGCSRPQVHPVVPGVTGTDSA
jgi:Protein of unknown function (DUF4232)